MGNKRKMRIVDIPGEACGTMPCLSRNVLEKGNWEKQKWGIDRKAYQRDQLHEQLPVTVPV